MEPFESRAEPRYPANEDVTFKVLPHQEKRPGKIVKVSNSGLLLEHSGHLDIGAHIEILTIGSVLFGEVRSCHPVHAGFQAGVRIDDAFFSARPRHIPEDSLVLYAMGRGLYAHEILQIGQHVIACEACESALAGILEIYREAKGAKET